MGQAFIQYAKVDTLKIFDKYLQRYPYLQQISLESKFVGSQLSKDKLVGGNVKRFGMTPIYLYIHLSIYLSIYPSLYINK